MISTLLKLLDNYDYSYQLNRRLNDGFKALNKAFETEFTALEDKEDHYELVLGVDKDAKASNVTVDYDDDTRELSIEYKYEREGYKSRSSITETLPKDADEDTIDAVVKDGKLSIIIAKKEPEKVEEEVVDEETVKVNRKNK